MAASPILRDRIFSLPRSSWTPKKSKKKKKTTIVVGLKSDNCSREMLLRLLTSSVVKPGDDVLAVHVQDPYDSFDPNSFYFQEDLCKSKQVDFHVKICVGQSFINELSHQVRINFASILALGCSTPCPKGQMVAKCLKALPPTCSLLVMDTGGRILIQRPGTCQEGSECNIHHQSSSDNNRGKSVFHRLGTYQQVPECKVLQPSASSLSKYGGADDDDSNTKGISCQIQKSLTMPPPSTPSSPGQTQTKDTFQLFQRLAFLEAKGSSRRFTSQEIERATDNFSSEMLIGEGGHSKVYRAMLDDGQAAAVKVLKTTPFTEEDLLREVEMLSGLEHENLVKLIGYCHSDGIHAVVYNLLVCSLKQKLKRLRWNERMRIAVEVAKALSYLHSCSPPIIHRDVKSSNILLSEGCQPQLSDFGAALVHNQTIQAAGACAKPYHVVGTFGYLAPEYMMFGKIDQKIDVYSYGVVLLELITGREAIQTNPSCNHESLVLWARSLLSCGLCERLIDPNLREDYDKEEMRMVMIAARLCLLHSSSRRPTMKTILQLFEEPEHWLKMQRKREELLNRITSKGETDTMCTFNDSEADETLAVIDE